MPDKQFVIKWYVDGEPNAIERQIIVKTSVFAGMNVVEAEDHIQELVDNNFADYIQPYVDAYALAYELLDLGVVTDY